MNTQKGKPPLDVWLSGTEHIHLISDLFDVPDNDTRMTGRSSRLACKFAELAMQPPNQRIIVRDHFETNTAHYTLLTKVAKIMDTLGVDYEIGTHENHVRDPTTFTGTVNTGVDSHYIIARPKMKLPF